MPKLIQKIIPLNDFIYLLQLEEYDSWRYFRIIPRFFFRRHFQLRGSLDFTFRVKLTQLITVILMGLCSLFFSLLLTSSILHIAASIIASLLLLSPLIPYFIFASNNLIQVAVNIQSKRIQLQAQQKARSINDLKIIAITGSYGKTTTKISLKYILEKLYRVQVTPGNINTPLGIANWLLKSLKHNTQVLIIEMDAYGPGEIKQSCSVVTPNIALITNFGDQHLERFGTHESLISSYLEVSDNPDTITFIHKEDFEKASRYTSVKNLLNSQKILTINEQVSKKYNQNSFGEIENQNIYNAVILAQQLQVPDEIIQHGLSQIELPDRRGDHKDLNGFVIIDRSYNISEHTARTGVQDAFRFASDHGRDLIVITAGIPERGAESSRVNKEYGQYLKGYAKYIILLQSIYAYDISSGIQDSSRVQSAARMTEALQIIQQKYSPSKCIVLMQPELTDLSY